MWVEHTALSITPHTSLTLTAHTSLLHTPPLTPRCSHLTSSHSTPHFFTLHTSHLTVHTLHLTPHCSHLTVSHLTPHTSLLTPHCFTTYTSHLIAHTTVSHLTPHTSEVGCVTGYGDRDTDQGGPAHLAGERHQQRGLPLSGPWSQQLHHSGLRGS